MTKNKPTGSSSANVQAPASTSETSTTIPVGNPTVPQAAANVNAEGVETRLSQTVETVRDAAVTPDAVASARAGINRTAEFALIISAELLAGKTYLRRGGRDVYQRIINTFL